MIHPPLKWHGGKHYLAAWILEQAPEHIHYVEPFAGGLSVLLRKPRGASEVVNDLSLALTNFWAVLADTNKFEAFRRAAEGVPFSESLWEGARDSLRAWEPSGEPDPAAALWFFIHVRQSRQGLQQDFATLSRRRTRGGMNEQASAWLSAVAGLPEAHERLKGVVVLSRPALDVLRTQDGPETWFYLDPPYHPSTRTVPDAYEIEMSEKDHEDLLEALMDLKGKFTLSGYRCPIYDEVAEACGWRRVDREIPNHSSSSLAKEVKIESLWMNY